ncbi:metallophosphoesterase family protein [Salinarimonas rosea]|uniref:metallophosphoesterase family protein n=1 Tax=Salinarimonas rosea TaxID=552063 RepID=UPI0003F741A3|nr:metallophosphoesterase [Salinarimonas rosea]
MAEAEERRNDPILDPRKGDVEDDAASPHGRSLVALAGSMLVEINLFKLALVTGIMIVLPALLLGVAPLLATGWLRLLPRQSAELVSDLAAGLTLIAALGAALLGGRALYRTTERSFWSLVSVVVQPAYVLVRESLRHLVERHAPRRLDPAARRKATAAATLAAGLLLSALASLAVVEAWPATRWAGNVADLRTPQRLIAPTLANSVVIVGVFLALAALAWSIADAVMETPRGLDGFDAPEPGAPIWRVAHVSDLHTVGGPYEPRLESGRAGPRGNQALERTLDALARADAEAPLDLILVSGDMTDAGRATEWAAFLDAVERRPDLAPRLLLLPGNHDLNIVDRANPARLELPGAGGRTLREMRVLSALDSLQGERVRVPDGASGRPGPTLRAALRPHEDMIRSFGDRGDLRSARALGRLWGDMFPMVAPPATPGGLGVVLLNSNVEASFSFTNALGLVSHEQARAMSAAFRAYPHARWIVALHHHVIEYPGRPRFASRIGTALLNGSAFVRRLRPEAERIVVMHGHRHLDWIGSSGPLRIVSAPSPVMTGGDDGYFYLHRLAAGAGATLRLLAPERIALAGSGSAGRAATGPIGQEAGADRFTGRAG